MKRGSQPPPPPPAVGIQGSIIPKTFKAKAQVAKHYMVIEFQPNFVTGTLANGNTLHVHLASGQQIRLQNPAVTIYRNKFVFVVRRPAVSEDMTLEIDSMIKTLGNRVQSKIMPEKDLPDWFPRPD